jgi:hypothetical protein
MHQQIFLGIAELPLAKYFHLFLESRQIILSTTLLIVIITVIVNGGTTYSVLSWLGVPVGIIHSFFVIFLFIN